MNLTTIPTEISLIITSFMTPRDLLGCATVNKEWCKWSLCMLNAKIEDEKFKLKETYLDRLFYKSDKCSI
jgi:hypothetical protein